MKRRRRSTQAGEYQDPLKDYSPPDYEDDLERSLCEEMVGVIQTKPFLTIDVETPIEQVLQLMAQHDIASVLVTEANRLIGIFSERDVLNLVAESYDAIKDHTVREVMTKNPVSIDETDSPAKAINLMAVGGFRHVPIVNPHDQVVGIVGPKRVTAYLCQHFDFS